MVEDTAVVDSALKDIIEQLGQATPSAMAFNSSVPTHSRAASKPMPFVSSMTDVQPKKATIKGAAEQFTDDVWIDPIAEANDHSKVNNRGRPLHPGCEHRVALTRGWPDPVRHGGQGPRSISRRGGRRTRYWRRSRDLGRPIPLARRDARSLHNPPLHHPGSGHVGRPRDRQRIRLAALARRPRPRTWLGRRVAYGSGHTPDALRR